MPKLQQNLDPLLVKAGTILRQVAPLPVHQADIGEKQGVPDLDHILAQVDEATFYQLTLIILPRTS